MIDGATPSTLRVGYEGTSVAILVGDTGAFLVPEDAINVAREIVSAASMARSNIDKELQSLLGEDK